VFVAGAASGAKDIPDSILHAGAAVAQAAAHLEKVKVPV
jgi:heterodisulfide reductase subunit A-like polyferredoxin